MPIEVPANETVTYGRANLLPASVTTPLTTVFCANKNDVKNKKNDNKKNLLCKFLQFMYFNAIMQIQISFAAGSYNLPLLRQILLFLR